MLGERITERGLGNGISLIIMIGILAQFPQAFAQEVVGRMGPGGGGLVLLLVEVVLWVLIIAGCILLVQGTRRIPVQFAKRVQGNKQYGGVRNYIPLKVNAAGVMPIIFAQAILMFPGQIVGWAFPNEMWARNVMSALSGSNWIHYTLIGLMIFFFSYFWVATMFQPNQIADDLKKNGGYIPGVRPGKPTAEFLDKTMSRLTFAGAIFLTLVAVMPPILTALMGVPPLAAQFFGGTGLLIMVGVLLDVMRQVETHLIQRHYDGFLRKGRIRGRFDRPGGSVPQRVETRSSGSSSSPPSSSSVDSSTTRSPHSDFRFGTIHPAPGGSHGQTQVQDPASQRQ